MHRSRAIAVFVTLAMLGVPAGPFRAMAQSSTAQSSTTQSSTAQGSTAQGSAPSEELAAANELMAVMSKDTIRQMVSNLTSQVWPTIERAVRAKRADIDQNTLAELRAEFEHIELEYMANVMADAPQIYARHFTAAELREMLAFYRTPTGQKSVQVMPQVLSEVFIMVMPKMQVMQAQILEVFTRVLRQRGIDL